MATQTSTASPASAGQVQPAAVEIASVSRSFGEVRVLDDVSLSVRRGEFLALLGGSGCGKTTLLRIIAGLDFPDVGVVRIGGQDVTATEPYARPVNMMFQSYALFPHLTVARNIEYGLRAQGVEAGERRARIDWALNLVRLQGLADRKPEQLSGGQRQRVALARCLVKRPAVLLLDEPMAALDRGLREEMQRELVRIQRDVGTTFILVTHDQDEAMSVADRIAVMAAGKIVQLGSPREIYDRPATRMVARFIGRVNLFEGALVATGGADAALECADGARLRVECADRTASGNGTAAIRPERMTVSRQPTGLANDFRGTVVALAYFGDMTRAEIRLDHGTLVEATLVHGDHATDGALQAGTVVHVGFAASAAVVLFS